MRVLRAALLCVMAVAWGGAARAAHLIFGTDWKAEHAGYYQTLATGIYKKYGIEVKLEEGGPQVNHSELLAAGRLDLRIMPGEFVSLIGPAGCGKIPSCGSSPAAPPGRIGFVFQDPTLMP